MNIFNFTPHTINIIDGAVFNPAVRKYEASAEVKPVATIPSSGMLNAKMSTELGQPVNDIIPTFVKKVIGCDPLPDEVGPDDIVVVSALYATAYRQVYGDDNRVYTVADPVYAPDDGSGKATIIGCRGICPTF
jgi:hypothetical protein